jgi:alpha-tubulin suppressor-like RCC1 family protein
MRFSALVVAVIACAACDSTSPAPGASIHFTSISVGDDQVCALDDQHRAWCWGSNFYGQLGVSDSVCVVACGALPVTTDLRFTAITAGWSFTCALTADGTPYCWGSDDSDELGQTTRPPNTCAYNTASCSSTPLPVSGGWTFSQIAAGLQNGCGVTTTGVGKCWGGTIALNPLGLAQKPFSYPTPFTVVLSQSNDSTWESMNRPTWYTDCGSTSTHLLACWGFNSAGQAGIGTIGKLTNVAPTVVAAPTPLHGAAVGGTFGCALDASGNAYCWGSIPGGALGLGLSPDGGVACTLPSGADTCYPTPAKVVGGLTFTALAAGYSHVCAITASGDAYCWGQSYSGATGVGALPGATYVTTPTLVVGGLRFASIAAGNANTCGITLEGEAWCWGEALFGEIGNIGQTGQFSSTPIRITPRVIPP